MSVAVWPSDLPKPARDTFQVQRGDGRIRKAGGGPTGYRRQFSSMPRYLNLSIDVPRSLKAVFDNFYDDTTVDGSLPFYMPDPTTDGWPMLSSDGRPMLMPDGTPILLSKRWLCLFGDETPVEHPRGVRFDISFSVQVMP